MILHFTCPAMQVLRGSFCGHLLSIPAIIRSATSPLISQCTHCQSSARFDRPTGRAFAAPAVLTWTAKRRWIRLGNSPFATIISAKASKRITDLALSELIADKLPFTPSRLKAGPLASRIVLFVLGHDSASGDILGAEKQAKWLEKVLAEEHERDKKHPDRIELPD